MNVFHRYTRRSLRLSPARTLVTIIGIVLSMSLFTAVIEGAYSGLQYLIRGEIEIGGAYHGFYYGLDSETKDQLLADSAIDHAAVWRQVGWAGTRGSATYPYLLIEDVDGQLSNLLPFHLTQGSRMPENEHEILLPASLPLSLFPDDAAPLVGDSVTLDVGRLLGDGEEAEEIHYYSLYGELELVDASPRTYTVVGTYVNFPGSVALDKHIALTKGGGTGDWRVFFTLKNPRGIFTWFDNSPYGSHDHHRELMRYYGTFRSDEIITVLYGFAGVLVFLIAFGSISLIYNSFSISVSERTRQFGLLKSVGATKKQIRSTVLYEALLLSAVGIPIGLAVGCTGIGITLWALRDFFNVLFAAGDGLTTRIGLVPAPGPLALSAAVCLVTVLISAWVPARRAIRLTAIDAIRQSGDVKVQPHEVQVSPVTLKLFGFEGMMAAKSFKRGRKRYRSTIFSLFLSMTLFISASSLCAYITDTVEATTSGNSREDLRYTMHVEEGEDPDTALAQLTAVEGVTDGLYYNWTSVSMWVDRLLISEEFRRIQDDPSTAMMYEENGWINMYKRRVFLDDASFRTLCADNGIDPAGFFDPQAPAALFYNRYTTKVDTEDGGTRWISWDIYAPSAFPAVVREQSLVEIDGYIMAYIDRAESGEEMCFYYPWDYYDEFFSADPDGGVLDMDMSRAIILTREEATITYDHRVLAAVDEVPFAFDARMPALFYPYSMMEAVTGVGTSNRGGWVNYAFLTSDHRLAYANMSTVLKGRDDAGNLYDAAEYGQRTRMMVVIVNVFAYGFITLISLIAAANVFNTISTNISLRRREFAMLRSIGLSEKSLRKMMSYECVIYGLRGLLWGLPASVVMTYVIYRITSGVLTISFYIPWYSVAIAVGSVFAVVFATMLYAVCKLRQDDLVETLKSESF